MKILLVEDDFDLAKVIMRWLESEGHLVTCASDGAIGLREATSSAYDVIILDWMLPQCDGIEVATRLRRYGTNTPILMLTAKGSTSDKVKGIESGADDFLPKPFDMEELTARVMALDRRARINRGRSLQIGDLVLDLAAKEARLNGEPFELTNQEYLLLTALARDQGRTLSRDYILGSVWGSEDTSSNSVDVHIASLRRKLRASPNSPSIQTVHQQGYSLSPPSSHQLSESSK